MNHKEYNMTEHRKPCLRCANKPKIRRGDGARYVAECCGVIVSHRISGRMGQKWDALNTPFEQLIPKCNCTTKTPEPK